MAAAPLVPATGPSVLVQRGAIRGAGEMLWQPTFEQTAAMAEESSFFLNQSCWRFTLIDPLRDRLLLQLPKNQSQTFTHAANATGLQPLPRRVFPPAKGDGEQGGGRAMHRGEGCFSI